MITTLNNLALIAANTLENKISGLIHYYPHAIGNTEKKAPIAEIQEITELLYQTVNLIFSLMPIEIPDKSEQLINNHQHARQADTAKILERSINYLSQVEKGRDEAALARLDTMHVKSIRLVEWHTYLKEQVLV